MPLPVLDPAPPDDATLDRAVDVLTSTELAPIVELVLRRLRTDQYEARAVDGAVTFRRQRTDGPVARYEIVGVTGRNPLGDHATDRFCGLDDELGNLFPPRSRNAYPHGYDQAAQLFDHPHAPDLCVIHTAAHNWADKGGHLGEHGSIDAVQSRAPFIVAGPGTRPLGRVSNACRVIDVAPTMLALLGIDAAPTALLVAQDGHPVTDVLDGSATAGHVVGVLLDGTNPNVLHDMIDVGELPTLEALVARGTSYLEGAQASLPTVTLSNHTTALTGLHPGHHGILHNAWYDRAGRRQVITNSPETWADATQFLNSGVETVHEALHRREPSATTISVNEPCDRGADYSTFDVLKSGRSLPRPPGADDLPDATEQFVRPSKDYRHASRTDHSAVDQFCGIWGGTFDGRDWPLPRFSWLNFTLTDAAFHEGGPHSEIARAGLADTDARLGRCIEAIERRGVLDRTAFVVVADHGMEQTDPGVTGDWTPILKREGFTFRDEAFGFLYFQ